MKTTTIRAAIAAALTIAASAAIPTTVNAGATRVYDVDDYVQTGLILHFDGIRNAGADAPHDATATTWKNLGSLGSTHDATLTTLASSVPSGAKEGAWTDDGYAFGGKQYFALGGTVSLGNTFTAQTCVDYYKANQVASYPNLFGAVSDNSDDFAFYSKEADGKIFLKLFNKSLSGGLDWTMPYATALYDGTGDKARVAVGGEVSPDWLTTTVDSQSLAAKAFAIGAAQNSDARKATRILVGSNHFVRVYSRVLSKAELAHNRIVDDARFQSDGYVANYETDLASVNVILRSSAAVCDLGDGWMGKYIVDGTATFTAPQQVATSANTSLVSIGYTLETWDGSEWVEAETHTGKRTFTYTSGGSKVRVTWQWRERAARRVYDVGDYVQTGLILHFDGIRNAGADAPHDATAATWKNLVVGGPDASFVRNDASYGSWKDGKGFYFEGKNRPCGARLDEAVTLGPNMTIQVAVDVDVTKQQSYNTKSVYPLYFGGPNPDFGIFQGTYNAITPTKLTFKHSDTYSASGDHAAIDSGWNGWYATAVLSSNRSYLTQTTSLGSGSVRNPGTATAQRYSWGTRVNTSGDLEAGRAVIGTFHSVRVYENNLDEDQLAWNRMVDNERFRMVAPGEANVVVASNIGGVAGDDECGEYAVQGGYEFTAPATRIVGKIGYTLNGYTIQTWNGTEWGAAVTNSGASYTASASDAKVRLTWLWTPTIQRYDVDDYVQDDLILHFDGIRNAGATVAHDSTQRTWKNIVAGQTDATFSNDDYGYWTEDGKGFYFEGYGRSCYAQLDTAVTFGDKLTIQLVTAINTSDMKGGSSKDNNRWPSYFHTGDSKDFGLYGDAVNANATPTWVKFKSSAGGNRPQVSSWGGEYLTAMLDGSVGYLTQAANRDDSKETNAGNGLNGIAERYCWGGSAVHASRAIKGTYYSVRIYTNVLDNAQLEKNKLIDDIRFRNGGVVEVVNGAVGETGDVGASSLPDGIYNIETGTWTITAGSVRVEDSGTYLPKLLVETYNATTGKWEATTAKPQWAEAYTIDKVALGGNRIRLTWTWEKRKGLIISFF